MKKFSVSSSPNIWAAELGKITTFLFFIFAYKKYVGNMNKKYVGNMKEYVGYMKEI